MEENVVCVDILRRCEPRTERKTRDMLLVHFSYWVVVHWKHIAQLELIALKEMRFGLLCFQTGSVTFITCSKTTLLYFKAATKQQPRILLT